MTILNYTSVDKNFAKRFRSTSKMSNKVILAKVVYTRSYQSANL